MNKIELKSRKILRKMFNGISLTAVAFIFQACYGPCPGDCDMHCDVKITGRVISKTTNLPVKGIKVFVNEGLNYGFTDEDGKYDFYASILECFSPNLDCYSKGVNINFSDIDGIENGHFANKTINVKPSSCRDEVKIDVELDEAE